MNGRDGGAGAGHRGILHRGGGGGPQTERWGGGKVLQAGPGREGGGDGRAGDPQRALPWAGDRPATPTRGPRGGALRGRGPTPWSQGHRRDSEWGVLHPAGIRGAEWRGMDWAGGPPGGSFCHNCTGHGGPGKKKPETNPGGVGARADTGRAGGGGAGRSKGSTTRATGTGDRGSSYGGGGSPAFEGHQQRSVGGGEGEGGNTGGASSEACCRQRVGGGSAGGGRGAGGVAPGPHHTPTYPGHGWGVCKG